ncbi:MAG: hypothetical protein RBS57_10450, partial [Desulforhabdus sp.]|nr:hypothetical protein [Desulforhabdus sp.]
MRYVSEKAGDVRMRSAMMKHQGYIFIVSLIVLVLLYGNTSWALQRHTLMPEQPTAEHTGTSEHNEAAAPVETNSDKAAAEHKSSPAQPSAGEGHAPEGKPLETPHLPASGSEPHATASAPGAPVPVPKGEGEHAAAPTLPEGLPEHEEEDGHAEHGAALPQISPTPGVTFVQTM